MNCQLCQKEFDAYLEGKLPESVKIQVETHLKTCESCYQSYLDAKVAYRVIEEERKLESNPFLSTRVMAGIEALEPNHESYRRVPLYEKAIKPTLITISLAAALFIGVVIGNIYKPAPLTKGVPVEMAYMNDGELESVALFSNE